MPSKPADEPVSKSSVAAAPHECCGGNGECACSAGCQCAGDDCGCGDPPPAGAKP